MDSYEYAEQLDREPPLKYRCVACRSDQLEVQQSGDSIRCEHCGFDDPYAEHEATQLHLESLEHLQKAGFMLDRARDKASRARNHSGRHSRPPKGALVREANRALSQAVNLLFEYGLEADDLPDQGRRPEGLSDLSTLIHSYHRCVESHKDELIRSIRSASDSSDAESYERGE